VLLVWRERLLQRVRDPLVWILLVVGVLRLVAIGWGLPSSTGWDNDGVAPRDFLFGLVRTYEPGSFFTYPPVHLMILAVLTAPGWILGLVRARSFVPSDVVAEFVKVPYMTAFSLVARLVSAAMSIGIVVTLAAMATEIRGKRAGLCVAVIAGINVVFNYYAHTSNLDVPCLFWGMLSLLALMRAVARRDTKRLRACFLLAAVAIGTKDQAYALFLLTLPLVIVSWFLADPWARAHARTILREIVRSGVLALLLLLVIDGAPLNPSGFGARIRFLAGTASQDHATYAADAAGWLAVVRDSLIYFERYYPLGFVPLVAIGVGLTVSLRGNPPVVVAGLVPLLAVVSFTLAFNCVSRRTEHRFLLPQMLLWSVYAGLAAEALLFQERRSLALASRVAAVPLVGYAVYQCAAVNVALLRDPRYDAEAWIHDHVRVGDVVEVYGNDAYLPRFSAELTVTRVDTGPLANRSVIPGVTEIQAPFSRVEQRRPDWIVLCEGWAWRFLYERDKPFERGKVVSPAQMARERDIDAIGYFRGLVRGEQRYALTRTLAFQSRFWPVVDIHASTARRLWIFQRVNPASPPD
jgi:hypothetical protein